MASFSFFRNKIEEDKHNNIVILKKYNAVESSSEYYTYSYNGKEQKYTGIISKLPTGYIGKTFNTYKVQLSYVEGLKSVEGNEEYYTYLDGEKEVKYIGNVIYNNDTDTYTGIISKTILTDNIKQIFPIDK